MKSRIEQNPTPPSQATSGDKAPYATPGLRVFGAVKHLTKGGGGSRTDGNGLSKDRSKT